MTTPRERRQAREAKEANRPKSFVVHLPDDAAELLAAYCKPRGLKRKDFVSRLIREALK